MRTILVPVEVDGSMVPALDTALLLARRYDSYIEGFALRSTFGDLGGADALAAVALQAANERDLGQIEIQGRHIFVSYMRSHNIPQATATTHALSFGWIENAPAGDNFVGSHGRVFDVIVMNPYGRNRTGPHERAIYSGLFGSGRPILLAAPTPPPHIATNVLIAWNCSVEQARATALAMPLLQKAGRVTVLKIMGGTEVPGPAAEQVVRYLRRSQISVDLKVAELVGKNTGQTILATAQSLGCDLLVKGAFTQSRLRQMVFGGATQHILEQAMIPVLFAN